MKILITGANGQLGREMHNVLEAEFPGNAVYADIDTLDLTDLKAVERFVISNDITHIVNCAGYTAVDRAEEEKLQCTAVNVDAVKNLARVADSNGVKVIHISTDYVFDGQSFRPYSESDKVNPSSQYGTTKRKGETALLALAPESIIIRTQWLYSPYGSNFVKTILNHANDAAPLRVVTDQIGTPTYAADLARAIYRILRSHQWVEGIYHYSNSGVASWYDFAKAILELSGNGSKAVEPILTADYPTVATRPFYTVLDKQRIRATYGVDVPYWRDSLNECLKRIINQ